MKINTVPILLSALYLIQGISFAQDNSFLLFGKAIRNNKVEQCRLEVQEKDSTWYFTYAPYGIPSKKFENVIRGDSTISFIWDRNGERYQCRLNLISKPDFNYKGVGIGISDTLFINFHRFNEEDALLQGNFIMASETDLQILDKAEELLQDGGNWNRNENRICNEGKVSLFCALYQASILISGDYQHIGPAMRSVRYAIEQLDTARKYDHILMDYNNEANSFNAIALVLKRGKEYLEAEISRLYSGTEKFECWKKYHIMALNARSEGRWETAAKYFQKSGELKGISNFEEYWDATIMNARSHKIDEAFNALNRAIDAGMDDPERAKANKRMDPLKNDPRWKSMIEKMTKSIPLEETIWQNASLKSAKIDPAPVLDLAAKIESDQIKGIHSFLLAKDGKLVYEQYFNGWRMQDYHEIRSAQKSITALLVGIAIDKGFIQSVHDPILKYFPKYKPTKNWDERKRSISVYHLLTMTSGLDSAWYGDEGVLQNQKENKDWVEYMLDAPMKADPGRISSYSSSVMNILGGIIENASGMPIDAFAEKYLFTPLELYHKTLRYDPSGRMYCAGGAELTSRDMLKLGQLIVNDGKWNNKMIISKKFLSELESKHSKVYDEGIDYGYLWHIVDIMTKSGEKVTSYGAYGNGGQFIIAIPDLKIVAVFTAENYGRPEMGNTIQYFEKSVVPNLDLP